MECYEAMLNRRSIRKYDEAKHVSDEQIDMLLKAAMAAPSAHNKQPWEFYVIKSKDIQEKIRGLHEYYNRNSDLMIVVCGNRLDQDQEQILDFWVEDCSAAVENMLLEATELGLGSLWCGIYPRENAVSAYKDILGLKGDDIIPMALLHFGYKAEERRPKTEYKESKIHFI